MPNHPKRIDASLVAEARRLMGVCTPAPKAILTELVTTVAKMWETAADASERHRDILACLDNAVIQAADRGAITDDQLKVIVAALSFLGSARIGDGIVECTRSIFIRVGFGPLALLPESSG